MAVFNGAFPVLPGKVEAARAFAQETMGAQRAGYEESQRRSGITRETWAIQETPDGNAFVLVWFESSTDPEKVFVEIAQDSSDFSVWFREQVIEICGVDLAKPPEGGPELVLDWTA